MTCKNGKAISRRGVLAGGAGIPAMAVLGAGGQAAAAPDMKAWREIPLAERQGLLRPFSCKVSMWWDELPFLDRFQAAADAGFTTVEFGRTVRDDGRTPAKIRDAAREAGLAISCFSPGSPSIGDPDNHHAFMDWIEQSIEEAKVLDCPRFNISGHRVVANILPELQMAHHWEALANAAPILANSGIVGVVEPYNPYNHQKHFLHGRDPAVEMCRQIDSPGVKLNWDFFHMQRADGNLVTHFREAIDVIDYVQFADSPGRNEPGTGEINYGYVFNEVRAAGYTGTYGCELHPKDGNSENATAALIHLSRTANLA